MPDREEQATKRHAKSDLRKGRSASTAAGEFVREEIHHIRRGVHGARSSKQAIAIGLAKARRAGIPLEQPDGKKPPSPPKHHRVSAKRSRAVSKVLRREPHRAASKRALSAQAHSTAKKAARTRARHAR
jgi:hypothetical protein